MIPSTLYTNSQAFISMCPMNTAWMIQSKKWEACVKTRGSGERTKDLSLSLMFIFVTQGREGEKFVSGLVQ